MKIRNDSLDGKVIVLIVMLTGLSIAMPMAGFDGNGFADLAIGVPLEDIDELSKAGMVHVLDGSNNGLTSIRGTSFTQNSQDMEDQCEEDDRFGDAMTSGDFNGDGYADLAVGMYQSIDGNNNAGAVHVIFGSPQSLSASTVEDQFIHQGLAEIPGDPQAYSFFGSRLAAGDFNRDGFADLVIGMHGYNYNDITDSGAVIIINGSASGLNLESSTMLSQGIQGIPGTPEEGDGFGNSLACGDFNGDHHDDLAIGVNGKTIASQKYAGCVVILHGTATNLEPAGNPVVFQGMGGSIPDMPEENDFFGYNLSSGDYDGDGYFDLAIGVMEGFTISENDIPGAGLVHVLYGSGLGLSALYNQYFVQGSSGIPGSPETGDNFGKGMASGDLNGDGFWDLVIGVPAEDVSVEDEGAFHVLYGSGQGIITEDSTMYYQGDGFLPGPGESGDILGMVLECGDFDRDGFCDLALGIFEKTIDTPEMVANAGIVVIVRGSQTGLTDLRMQIWSQQSPNVPDDPEDTDLFGYSLAAGALKTQQPVCSETGVVLFMPDTDYVTGQTCSCQVLICNAEASPLENYPLFVILEVAGSYYFAPSFGEYDSYLDDYPVFSRGLTRIDVLDEFEWPPDVGSYSGCVFYAALTDPGITDIFGVMDDWTFGWH